MGRSKSWEVTGYCWMRVEPWIPVRQRPADRNYLRNAGGSRLPKSAARVWEAIVDVSLRRFCRHRVEGADDDAKRRQYRLRDGRLSEDSCRDKKAWHESAPLFCALRALFLSPEHAFHKHDLPPIDP